MARRNGRWQKTTAPGVPIKRFYAEIYSGDSAVDDYFSSWAAHRSIGRPLINVGPASPRTTFSATYRECRSVAPGTYIGIYSQSAVSPANGKLTEVERALNACTTS